MLNNAARQIIHDYLNLPFPDLTGVRCPYYNNIQGKKRAELKALIGKGNPREIVAEAQIISHQYENDYLKKPGLTADKVREFLDHHNLGVDCSGLVSQILQAENPGFYKKFKLGGGGWRWLIRKLRPLENLSVQVYADDKNTILISDGKEKTDFTKIQTGDLIIMLEIPAFKNRDHILLVTETAPGYIKYIHARQWQDEPTNESGAYEGIIKITRPGESLLKQEWTEKGLTGTGNQTFELKAKGAKTLKIKRLKN